MSAKKELKTLIYKGFSLLWVYSHSILVIVFILFSYEL